MIQLRCTEKARKLLGVQGSGLTEPVRVAHPLGAWYVNVFLAERRKFLVCMSEPSYLSFVIPRFTKTEAKNLPELFRSGLDYTLSLLGAPIVHRERAKLGLERLEFTKTANRKALGNLKELVELYEHSIWYGGGLKYWDQDDATFRLNSMPQRNLGWAYSRNIAQELLQHGAAAWQ
ncbi:MAG: hypothetical protein AAF458_07755 [Pseudomonadota bacterium]